MNIEKITKKELLGIIGEREKTINLKNEGIEFLKKEIEKQQARTTDTVKLSNSRAEQISKLKNQLKNAYLQGLSDVKSISALILIYETDSMTHREKDYLGKKLRQVIDKIIEQRMDEIGFSKEFGTNDDLPF